MAAPATGIDVICDGSHGLDRLRDRRRATRNWRAPRQRAAGGRSGRPDAATSSSSFLATGSSGTASDPPAGIGPGWRPINQTTPPPMTHLGPPAPTACGGKSPARLRIVRGPNPGPRRRPQAPVGTRTSARRPRDVPEARMTAPHGMHLPGQAPAVVAILVVGGDDEKRTATVLALEPLGHAIVEARSGEAALSALTQRTFAVILMDVELPGINGYEVVERIRMRSASEYTPLILMASPARDEARSPSRMRAAPRTSSSCPSSRPSCARRSRRMSTCSPRRARSNRRSRTPRRSTRSSATARCAPGRCSSTSPTASSPSRAPEWSRPSIAPRWRCSATTRTR